MFLTVVLSVKDGPAITATIPLESLAVSQIPNGVTHGYGWCKLASGGKTYAHVHIWSYYKDGKDWHEFNISNSSIEAAAFYYEADYTINLDVLGVSRMITRSGAKFYDGTGYAELFGRPQFAPLPGGMDFMLRNMPSNWNPIVTAAQSYTPSKQLGAYPLDTNDWNAANWSTLQFDPAINTHQTGTPNGVGDATMEAVFLEVLSKVNDAARVENLTDWVYGWIGQQSRRPYWFFHDANGAVWKESEYPKLVMSEYGPSKLWSATELWGRDKPPAPQPKSPWNGLELEHFVIDNLVLGYLGYGSMMCFTQIILLIEGLLTHPHMRTVKVIPSLRAWGWGLRGLAWAMYCSPFNADKLRYFKAVQNLTAAYGKSQKFLPIASVMEMKAATDHIYPTHDELLQYFDFKDWEVPVADETYQTKLKAYTDAKAAYEAAPPNEKPKFLQAVIITHNSLRTWLVSWIGVHHGTDEMVSVLELWSFENSFQCAVAAFATGLIQDVIEYGVPEIAAIRTHLLLCLMHHARNPNGTFWYDYATKLLGITSGDGVNKTGVNLWVAGCLGSLYPLVPVTKQDTVKAAIQSVYYANPYTQPSDTTNTNFYRWFLSVSKHLGFAP